MQSLLSLLGIKERAKEVSIDVLATEAIMENILDVCLLPQHNEVKQLMQRLSYGPIRLLGMGAWMGFCYYKGLYHIPTVEFVDELADEIRKLGPGPVVEVCAGNGKLSYHLSKRGVYTKATDDYSWKDIKRQGSLVENFSCIEALETYKPRIVITSWIPNYGDYVNIGPEVLRFPTVKHFINIQDHKGKALDLRGTSKVLGFEWRRLPNVEKYGVCVEDYPGVQPHTQVVLHTRAS